MRLGVIAGLALLLSLPAHASGDLWTIRKETWSAADETRYQEFIKGLGYAAFQDRCSAPEGRCRGIVDLLASEANPYREGDPEWIGRLHTDCADFPLTLRAYFAWKNDLPHAVASGVEPAGYCGTVRDTRFCRNGNRIVARNFVSTGDSAEQVIGKWSRTPTTSIFRTHYLDDQGIGSDFYTPAIDRDGITPGTLIYDPNGHTSMVFDVLDDGRMLYLEAKIGGEIATGYVSPSKIPLKPDVQGWGFKKWKPVRIVGAQSDDHGSLIGGRAALPRAPEAPGFSDEQHSARLTADDRYLLDGRPVPYFEFVTARLAARPSVIDPILEMERRVESLCRELEDRVTAVHQAIRVMLPRDPHPERLPPNIYGTGGHWQWNIWEQYSSPSRDAHIKTALKELADSTRGMIDRHRDGDDRISYRGDDLAADMYRTYTAAAGNCTISYANSAGREVTLDLLDITERAFRLSFDPYHCVELRWGAEGRELDSCPDDADKLRWYRNQQYLRNQLERRYDQRMDFSVEQLAILQPGNGVAEPPDIDVARYLETQIQSYPGKTR